LGQGYLAQIGVFTKLLAGKTAEKVHEKVKVLLDKGKSLHDKKSSEVYSHVSTPSIIINGESRQVHVPDRFIIDGDGYP